MSVFAISDVHGQYRAFMDLLDAIAPASDDKVIVAGDIIDRGPDSASMLRFALEADDRFTFLCGNHEDMFRASIVGDDPMMVWLLCNGGAGTLDQLVASGFSEEEISGRVLRWLSSLDPAAIAETPAGRYLVVHAGIDPSAWDGSWDLGFCDWLDYGYSRDVYDLTAVGVGEQEARFLLWDRRNILAYDGRLPVEIVFGHTPVFRDDFTMPGSTPWESHGGAILHRGRAHAIDCGAAYAGCTGHGDAVLGALRLDDLEEFYVRIRN